MRIMHISRASLMMCRFLVPVIEAQKKKGHYVCVCGSDDSDAQRLRDVGIDVFPHQLKRNLNPIGLIRAVLCIRRILLEQKIDAVICHSPIGAGVGRIAARLAKTPKVIYFAHGLPCAPGQNSFVWFLWFCVEKALAKITSAILVMNTYDENLAVRRLTKDPGKVFRVPGMGVDMEKFKAESSETDRQRITRELGIAEGKKIVLCLAYLIRAKGVFLYFEATRRICVTRGDVCFLLAGDGPSMGKLKETVEKNHQQEGFRLLGWRNDIPLLMRSCDIFVLPTFYFEGLPVSILEAMACGKPVVATRHRGCEDAVADGETGFLVPIKELTPLVDRISCLLCNEQRRKQMGRAARQRVEQHFGLDYCTEKIVEALEKASEE
ncbi:MAG TPA: glycosyltransferase family 4 protein [Sedimentisphaerales bacterium]|nr:glycosyltransferase family 4 protein [Sedimentisphaerales bacterium]